METMRYRSILIAGDSRALTSPCRWVINTALRPKPGRTRCSSARRENPDGRLKIYSVDIEDRACLSETKNEGETPSAAEDSNTTSMSEY